MNRVKQEQQLEPETFLRIGVAGGGCGGFNYTLGFDTEFRDTADTKYDCYGVAVVVTKKCALYLDGATIDWYEGEGQRGFTFDNPNAVRGCSCGG